ncbi:MAG: 23S rRNA (guanosine(2251)-2'-O)-methyltransferase RlmB [Proteobacteria bacterium]|nr:23S rRNA (guanosine(2251)-2'-O)-methyltransferase RlmB [Pseudomonadota bacterium]
MADRMIYGFHAVLAAIEHQPQLVLNIYTSLVEGTRVKSLIDKAKNQQIHIEVLTVAKLDKLTNTSHHQGIAAKVRMMPAKDEKALQAWLKQTDKTPLLLLLEEIQDPHNLGACLRSAQAFGVDWVVISKIKSATLSPVVSKIACGADALIPILQVSNMVRFIQNIQKLDIWVVGTSSTVTAPLKAAKLTRPLALVMGTEHLGLKALTLENCDEVIKIPLLGEMESLNVSVATGICLYEVMRNRSD